MTLSVLLVLLNRKFPDGALLGTFCILRPLSKIALEQLRATTPLGPAGLMKYIPIAVLTAATIAMAFGVMSQRWRQRYDPRVNTLP